MTPPNMSTTTASLQTSLHNCSLHHHNHQVHHHSATTAASRFETSSNSSSDITTVELNSNISLPYHWEQCLDLKTGEVFYINWRTGMKAKEDPRTTGDHGYFYSDDDDEDEDESLYSGSSSESSSAVSSSKKEDKNEVDNVLVVAGCKRCLMYLMVAKQVEECPKCSAQLLHFQGSLN